MPGLLAARGAELRKSAFTLGLMALLAACGPSDCCLNCPDSPSVVKLSAGQDGGADCVGYCRHSVETDGYDQIMTETAYADLGAYPDRKRSKAADQAQWQTLLAQADLKTFLALPENVDCPDCLKGKGEWLEFQYRDRLGLHSRRVNFRPEAGLPQLGDLVISLNRIYNDLHAVYPTTP